jgi:glycogen debranching enzyme
MAENVNDVTPEEFGEDLAEDPLLVVGDNNVYIHSRSSYADDRSYTLNHGDTFGVFDRWGDLEQLGRGVQGIYHMNTRFLSKQSLKINNKRALLLSSGTREANEMLSVDLTNPSIMENRKVVVPQGSIHISRNKFIRHSVCYERIVVKNYRLIPVSINLELFFEADFKDIFEVRGRPRLARGEIYEPEVVNDSKIAMSYKGLDNLVRRTEIYFYQQPTKITPKKASYDLNLSPKEEVELVYSISFCSNDVCSIPIPFSQAVTNLSPEIHSTANLLAKIDTSNHEINNWLERSVSDLVSLLAPTPHGLYPYAGVPWFNCPFGRDGILTALECLWIAPKIAKDVLSLLAANQSDGFNDVADAEPGKILHETRGGEMVELGELPFKMYYGTIDATPLFIALASAYFRRTADLEFIRSIWPNIKRALDWIDNHGDQDGDGFVEYGSRSITGLKNLGWKDSDDSISDEFGKLSSTPIALVEVQGYVYMAQIGAAGIAKTLGDDALAASLSEKANHLKQKFNEKFWDEQLGTYVLALDGDKKPCRVVSSNAGHTLFTGIIDEKNVGRVVESMISPQMFSGWGIRTLSTDAARYSPLSYHNGSVWPHDTALIAKGMAKYGYQKEAMIVFQSLFDSAMHFNQNRLPELFCGFQRREGEGPTEYPVACSPQAWAVATPFCLFEALLSIDIDAVNRNVTFNGTTLPDFLNEVSIQGLVLGNSLTNLKFFRYPKDVGLAVEDKPLGWTIQSLR